MIWATHVLQWTQRAAKPRGQQPIKLFSVRIVVVTRLHEAESLVIADQHATVNTFPVLYTPPVTPREFVTPEAGGVNPFGAAVEGGTNDWGEVVTR